MKKYYFETIFSLKVCAKKNWKWYIIKDNWLYDFEVISLSNTFFLWKQVFENKITSKSYPSKVDDKKIN